MRKLGVLLLSLPLLVAACGEEVAPLSDSTPDASVGGPFGSPHPQTPPQTEQIPVPTKLPSRPPLPSSAYQQLTVTRLKNPDMALRAPAPGHAQVTFACDYEEWSFQYRSNQNNTNPPGRHLRGDNQGDILNAPTANITSRALGGHGDALADDYSARSFTEDAWPERRLVTAFEVRRSNLSRANVLAARNQYAVGCSAMDVPPLLDGVHVSIYAPWDWKI
jgi:hypothetical protein